MFENWREVRRLRRCVAALEEKLELERERHLAREDALLDRVLTGANKHGLSERTVEPPLKPPTTKTEPVLSAEDEATLSYYRQCAKDAGLDEGVAGEWFATYLRGEEPVMQMEN